MILPVKINNIGEVNKWTELRFVMDRNRDEIIELENWAEAFTQSIKDKGMESSKENVRGMKYKQIKKFPHLSKGSSTE